MSRNYVNHIMTPHSITVVFDTGDPAPITVENRLYPKVKAALEAKKYDEVAGIIDMPTKIEESTKGKFTVRNGRIVVDGNDLPSALSKRLIQFVEVGIETGPLERFWDNLRENPSKDSANELYGFLEANHVPITDDGCFIGYKSVKANFLDHHTGTMDNTPGKVVSMPRDEVNPNRRDTCSTGLHVAAYAYAAGVMPSGKLLEVKVNPRDVVSVPVDHNDQKMRVCRYEVLDVNTDKELNDHLYGKKPDPEQEYEPASAPDPMPTKPTKIERPKGWEILKADKRGYVTIPGEQVKGIGNWRRKNFFLVLPDVRSRGLLVSTEEQPDAFHCSQVAADDETRAIKIPTNVLQKGKIAWADPYSSRVTKGMIELRQYQGENPK